MQSSLAKTLVHVRSNLKFAKCPRWIRQKLLFLDIHDRCIKSADLNGSVKTVRALPFIPGGFGILRNGGLIVGDALHRKIYLWKSTSRKEIADPSQQARFFLSDAIVDNRGGLYVSDVGFDFLNPLVDPVPNGVIVHISADGKSSAVARDLFFPNGMIITPDNSTLIVAETLGHRLTAFEIDTDGSLGNRRVWAQFQDEVKPDGICLDREGAIWVAGSGRCALHAAEGGEIDRQVTTSQPVYAIMLGGPERRHLFMCTSASQDPVITHRGASATIDIAEVGTPGVGTRGLWDWTN